MSDTQRLDWVIEQIMANVMSARIVRALDFDDQELVSEGSKSEKELFRAAIDRRLKE